MTGTCDLCGNQGLVFNPHCHLPLGVRARCLTLCPDCHPGHVPVPCRHRQFGGEW